MGPAGLCVCVWSAAVDAALSLSLFLFRLPINIIGQAEQLNIDMTK